MNLIQKIIFFFEMRSFGVCTWFGRKLGVKTEKIRLFFIYVSCFTFGSPILIYLIFAFFLEHKHIFTFQSRRKSIWEL